MPQIAVQKRYLSRKHKGRINEAYVAMLQKTFRCGVVLTALATFSAVPAFAKETPEQIAGRKAIATIYAKLDSDARKRNLKVMEATMAPDFKYHGSGRVFNRAQFLAIQRGSYATMESVVSVNKIQKIQWRGTDAIVWADSITHYKQQGASMEVRGQTRDFWSKTKKGWMIRQVAEISKRIFVNGQEAREQL